MPGFLLGSERMERANLWRVFAVAALLAGVFGVVPERPLQSAVPLPAPAPLTAEATAPAVLLSGVIAAPVPPRLMMPATGGPDLGEEFQCLSLNIYWEARSESWRGQVGVAMVTLNRVADSAFPDTVCDVVRQGGETRKYRCQFTWYCDGKRDVPENVAAWRRAQKVAYNVLFHGPRDPTRGALFYHADYVDPAWSRVMKQTTQIGRHLYYVES